ncbi:MAG TPA: response regulator transcription factor [Streptosporangiaceae bacterium]|nr:response regulator transcription factor [Streptosporangiaceae bacterium]
MVKVLVIDENPVLGLGVFSLLADNSEIELVDGPLNFRPNVGDLGRYGADVIVFGASPPSIEHIRALARNNFGARLAVLTSTTDPGMLLRVLTAGAHSCVVHGYFEPRALPAAVLATARGESVLSPPAVTALVAWLHRGGSAAEQPKYGPRLTTREVEIMELISAGLNNRRIADRLVISEKTVKNHVHSIYKRLGASGRDHAVQRWRRLNSGEGAADETAAID